MYIYTMYITQCISQTISDLHSDNDKYIVLPKRKKNSGTINLNIF